MDIEIDTLKQIIFVAAVLAGCIMRIYIPYRIKRIKEQKPFDLEYVYAMALGFLITAIGVLQIDVIMAMPLEFESVIIIFISGNGLQDIINRAIPKRKPQLA